MRGIIMLHGLPGSGKSWLAGRLGEAVQGSVVLKTAVYRKLQGLASPAAFDEDIPITRREKDDAYRSLIEDARKYAAECCVILDATFHKRYRREWVYALAEELHLPLLVVSVTCPDWLIAERIEKRRKDGSSDACLKSLDAKELMKKQSDPLIENQEVIVFDSGEGDVLGFLQKVRVWLNQ